MHISFDIETVANDRARQFFEEHWEPPGNVTKPETIAAKRKEQIETLDGAGLHWWTGRVACICACDDEGTRFECCHEDERWILESFFGWCKCQEARGNTNYIGKNGIDFDIPFLIGRAMALCIPMPYHLSGRIKKEPLLDVDKIFGWSKNGQYGKLAYYAWGLDIGGKTGHGSEVQGMWNDGKLAEIQAYCKQDVDLVSQIIQRWKEISE